ncbi:hypothetical protein HOLleu_08859 [Holothuria leucospilota]|uniref:Uncharacterized protein n=1 Tax=Holothuria leucospilota TaxID=206669 RepID=A0A9Q1HI79_HOLLE|nr:hypothetical protein HOLleu_08859 [Holothuria leucospilota]
MQETGRTLQHEPKKIPRRNYFSTCVDYKLTLVCLTSASLYARRLMMHSKWRSTG